MLSEEKLKQISSKYKRRYDPKTGKEIIGSEAEKDKVEETKEEEKEEKVSENLEDPNASFEEDDDDDNDELPDENSPFYEGDESVLEDDIEEDVILDDDYEEENKEEDNLDNEPDFSANDGYDDYRKSLEDEYGDEFYYLMDEDGGNDNEEDEEEIKDTDEKPIKKEEEKVKKEPESVKRSQKDPKIDEKDKVGLKDFSEDVKEEVKNIKTNYSSFDDYEKPKTVNVVTNYVDYEGSIKKHEEFVNDVKDGSKSKQKSITKIPESIAKIIDESIKTAGDKSSLALKLTVFVLLYTDIEVEEINMMETDLVSREDVEEALKINSKASKYAETLSLVNNIDANTIRTRIDQQKFMKETDEKLVLIMSIVMAMIHDSYGLRKGEYPSSVDDLDFHSKQLAYMFENLYRQYPEIRKMVEKESRKNSGK